MGHWTKSAITTVNNNLGMSVYWIPVGFNDYTGRTTPKSNNDIKETDLIIGYNTDTDLYVAWNALVHRKKGFNTQTFSVPKKYVWKSSEEHVKETIYPVYKFIHGNQNYYEKLVIFQPEFLMDFCKEPFLYLLPDINDENYAINTLFACPNDRNVTIWTDNKYTQYLPDTYREYYSCKRAKRDASFKKRVFSKYDFPRCVVCGITVQLVLEAAHIIAVKDGGNDEPENGICLCRNHHRLFDEQLILVDDNKHVFRIMDKTVAESLKCECDVDYSFK